MAAKRAETFFPLVAGDESKLNHSRHINYWRRCLKTYLPYQYTSNDSNRMSLAFFIVSALDVLGNLETGITPGEREGYINWIYHCQHPEGGFRAFPATDFGELRNENNKAWDPANVPATFFALLMLAIFGDDLERVKRRECLEWLTRMQRPDGSFGETIGENGRIEGGNDIRFGYTGTGIRWILRGSVEGPVDGVSDINVDKLVECIRISETYDGGISEARFHEAHAGFTFCAISALSFLDRLPLPTSPNNDRVRGLSNLPLTLHWLASRQTATLDDDDAYDTNKDGTNSSATCHDADSFAKLSGFPPKNSESSYKGQPTSQFETQWTGMNGRCNKIADTCYAFWVTGSLATLNHLPIIDRPALRRYLLDKVQHLVGGFGKMPGDPPDLYHSYLGLATMAILDEPGLKSFDAPLCMSNDARKHLESLSWRRKIVGIRDGDEAEIAASSRVEIAKPDGMQVEHEASSDRSHLTLSGG
ncbi:geranylgeranyl transferase type I beta subunit [Lepidopterella palustris CBS 459.81]|uniref:Geranylgeranyl transferase type I beta subunit n=1 Tax=Lepidopterella palustris CBS 459.81 TaxID=1314670 RepID=A0A8E2EH65_9PEZI|nr:geranylgeranyl transferase type I beta subunit [Lepidopterella palustris CBS 459.81]